MNKFLIIFALLLVFIRSSYATEKSSEGHFAKHVLDAYNINTERLPLYSELTNGKSEKVSRKLLFMESLLLPVAKLMDMHAFYFQQEGIAVLQKELMPMDLLPFKEQAEKATAFFPLDISKLKSDLNELLDQDDFINFSKKTDEYLTLLENEKGAHCLVRHFLESIRRSANYAPIHIRETQNLNIASPKKLIKRFIKLHLFAFKNAEAIDHLAYPLQAEGLPIICQDVPVIPAW